MRRLFLLLLCLALVGGCARQPSVPEPEPEPTPAVREEAAPPAFSPERYAPPPWKGSEPQQGAPIVPQPGDTAACWDMARAGDFSPDDDCSDGELLAKWLAVEGLTLSDLEDRGCTQLVLTVAREEDGVFTLTTCYAMEDNAWHAQPGLTRMAGYTGSNGIAHDRRRNTRQSPAGLWALGSAFGLASQPAGLLLPWRDITPQSDWVCDAASPYFNTWQERDDPLITQLWDLQDAEHLEDYSVTYRYACVIEYNTPPYTVPDRGCAIFLHCSDHPTSGCIGLLEEDMVRTLLWLDPRENPHILITGHEKPR